MSDKRFERSFSQQCKNLVKVLIDIIACYWLAIPLLVLEALKFIFPKRKNVSGQLVLVTGAGGGLGRSISLRLADLGCNIAVVDINQETAESVAQKLQKKGVRATAFKADISKYDEIKKLRNDVTNSMGKVDILINNAGLIPNMSTQMGPGFLEKMISVNVLGTIWTTRAFIEQMKQGNGGHIVAISSMSGLHPSPFAVDYSATKAAINSFMAGLREKLRLENLDGKIKITTVCPYYITTRQDISDFLNPEIRFPPLEVEVASREIVDAILRNETLVSIPSSFKFSAKLLDLFPLSIQQLVRDRFLKEYDFKSVKK